MAIKAVNPEAGGMAAAEGLIIPEEHQISLQRTLRIAGMVGSELGVTVVKDEHDIPPEPGVYLLEGEVDTDRYEEIDVAQFALAPKSLSGKADSAHAVLPGTLTVSYKGIGPNSFRDVKVAAKGYYKRPFAQSLERVKTEVEMSKLQEQAGEVAFQPIAVVIASPPYSGKGTDYSNYDVLLVTRLNEPSETLDNAPWQLGYTEANLEAAEAAISALGRYNTSIGLHGDSKIKNVVQKPDGRTSMIDFETSKHTDINNPAEAAHVVLKDVGLQFDSLLDRGFFTQEPYRTRKVLEKLGEIYLDHWVEFSDEVVDSVYQQVAELADRYTTLALAHAYSKEVVVAG